MKYARRDILRMSLVAGTYGAIWRGRRPKRRQDAPIIVIGAGMAGLAAARELMSRGHTAVVLEGRERVGGRVWTNRDLGVPVDLGASWIHGVDGNPITEISGEADVDTRPTDYENVSVFDADGSPVAAEQIEETAGLLGQVLEGVEEVAAAAGEDMSMADAIEAVLEGVSLDAAERRALSWALAAVENAAGEDLRDLSVAADEGEGFDGGDRLFPGGYHQIIEAVGEGVEVRTGQVVCAVRHSDEGVEVVTRDGVVEGAAAIVTVPLGVLKSGAIEFEPGLPDWKQESIAGLNMGVLDKIVLGFERPFWPREPEFFGYMSETHGEFPTILNYHHYTGDPLLMAFTAGSFARALERESDEDVGARLMEVLRRMFGNDIPDPAGMVRARWIADPFAGGSYSHVPPGGSSDCHDGLAEPVGDTLFFAGEATHREHQGTVHGAFLSGVREAERIAAG